MDWAFKLVFLLAAAAAVVVGAWIGYRATDGSSDVCVAAGAPAGIVCVNPATGESTYRLMIYDSVKKEVKTFPER